MKVKVNSLGLGDIVRISSSGPYSDATVYQVYVNGNVRVWRPYVATTDVAYSGGPTSERVIPTIGIEDFELYDTTEIDLIRKNPDTVK